MKILQISTYDIRGGAAIAAYRLHRGLRKIGQDCQMLVRYKKLTDNLVYCITSPRSDEGSDEKFFLEVAIQEHYIDSHRTDISNSIFSLPYPGYDLSTLEIVRSADVLNLHWVARYQSPLTLHKLFALGKPIVWTLHDQWAFTGGCHYSAGCKNYVKDCSKCPQLAQDRLNLPAAVLRDRTEFLKDGNLTIVTPSRWMASCSRESRLFKDLRTEVIPNSLETDVFKPIAKEKAKGDIGLDPQTVTLLFGGEDGNENRKGFKELMAAIRYCLRDARFQGLIKDDRIRLICFGRPNDEIESLGVPVMPMGYLDGDEKISTAYNGADIFILPSKEDNLPNTVLEAMSCGTPVVAFEVGGLPDMVENGMIGQLVPLGDIEQMGQAILTLIFDTDSRDTMGKNCRNRILEEYTLDVQAQRYLALYEELIKKNRLFAKNERAVSICQDKDEPLEIGSDILTVPVESGVGPHFYAIYDRILFEALKGYSLFAKRQWEVSEADRAARLEQVNKLTRLLKESEADRKARLEEIKRLWAKIRESDVERRLREMERDNQARLDQINELTRLLKESEADRKARLDQINELTGLLIESEADRKARLEQIDELTQLLQQSEKNLTEQGKHLTELTRELTKLRKALEQEMRRTETLKRSFMVRLGLKVGLIKVEPTEFSEASESCDEKENG